MMDLKDARKKYESIDIPEELETTVSRSIKKSGKKIISFPKRMAGMVGAAAMLAVVLTTVLVNTNESFAKGIQEIPVIGTVAKVLTFREYNSKDDDRQVTAKVPKIQEAEGDSKEFILDVNAEIQKKCDDYVKKAEQDIADYKEAFLETGGTEEEFKEHNIKVDVSYDVKSQNDQYLSFVVNGTESWSSAYAEHYFYNLDVKSGRYLSLKDILGENYITTTNEQILLQMKERAEADKEITFFTEEEGGFTTITEATGFYLNEAGNPVIVFDKYEVAPGFMGAVEFEIVK